MIKLGAEVKVKPSFLLHRLECPAPIWKARVVYIHPRWRFVVVQYASGTRESFYPEELL